MADTQTPRIYLVTPPEIDAEVFPDTLAAVLDRVPVECLRLDLATTDEDRIARAADAVREVAHRRDVAVVVAAHVGLVERLGLDGVHLLDGARSVRKVRKALGGDRIVGAFCGHSRHDGMSAGEAGADYVSFGPVRQSQLGDGSFAEPELFAWWSEMIEIPVVAEGVNLPSLEALMQVTDFVVPDTECWRANDPADAFRRILEPLL
ncbi:thiamine phosphate synthase [Roseitranquillus sediminis]|uniref:thiamine phosphate synthase n=1 Tax=Roseitranquillus sediminis TaxID=2809051 RepID=UPI001D0C7B01|nr:thiamine phosphate synthase [Roseitranquillus sediminis]MBM9595520.1 thiamine phosphate synthase [Roseitranquillus sediminis]